MEARVDQAQHPENSDEAKSELLQKEIAAREQKQHEWFERTGGAFHPSSVFGVTMSPGITIRDYFAAAVLAQSEILSGHPDVIAEAAYSIADAMLRARKAVDLG